MKLINRRYLKISLFILVAVAALVAVFFFATKSYEDVETIAETTSGFVDTLRWFRWGLILALAGFWPQLTSFIVTYKNLNQEQQARLAAFRWRVPLYLAIFELLVIESLPSKILGL